MSNGSRIQANIHSNIKKAYGATAMLVFLFVVAAFIVVICMNILVVYIVPAVYNVTVKESANVIKLSAEARMGLSFIVTVLTSLVLVLAWWGSYMSNSSFTGSNVAERAGAQRVPSNTTNVQERELLNIVEELSARYGIAMPPVFIEDANDINAFAAGLTPQTAAVSVTRGSMKYFTREELRAVLGHEFGHIVNGDCALHLNMGCAASGFSFVETIGRFFLNAANNEQVQNDQRLAAEMNAISQGYCDEETRNRNDQAVGGAAAIAAFGLGFCALGFIGYLAAQLIIFAVSRQREFLADSTSAKMIGDPEAMAHALMKIKLFFEGGYQDPQSSCSPNREAIAQFYFAPLSSWFQTHPSTDDRIKHLLPSYNGVIPDYIKEQLANPPELTSEKTGEFTSSQMTDSSSSEMSMEQVGNASAQASVNQFNFSQPSATQNQQVVTPVEQPTLTFSDYIRDPYYARCAIFALLIDANQEVRINQWNYLQRTLDSSLLKLVQTLLPVAIKFSCAEKISLTDKSLYALQQMSISQYKDFRLIVYNLAIADQRLDLFEMTLYALITGRLDCHYVQNQNAVKYTDAIQLTNEFQVALGYIAYSGAVNPSDVPAAIAHVCKTFNFSMPVPAQSDCTQSAFFDAMQKIQFASTPIKTVFFKAFIECVNYDGKVTTREREIVYALGSALNLRFELD